MLLANHLILLIGVAINLDHQVIKLVGCQGLVILHVHHHVVVENIGTPIFKKQVIAQVSQFADGVDLWVEFHFLVILRKDVGSSPN
jgi:hypothetical protein